MEPFIGETGEWGLGADGLGVDGVVDAAGISATLKTALQIVRPAGWICKVGWGRDPLDFSLDPLVQKNVTLRGSFSHNWPVWEKVIGLIASRRLPVRSLIGRVLDLEHWNEGFEAMHSGEILKAVLKP
jgi:alcohol dehydrogenase/L-iditol 2-dehydrogenase